jgi:uncharacterized protein
MAFSFRQATILGGVLLTIFLLALFTFQDFGIAHLLGLQRITVSYLYITRTLFWLVPLLLWQFSARIERQSMLIWPEINYPFWTSVLSLVVLTTAIAYSLLDAQLTIGLALHKKESSSLLKVMTGYFRTNPFLLVYTALTAGVTEELIFRGYLLPRLNLLLRSPFLAIISSSLIFGLAHFRYGTIMNVVGPFFIGLGLAFYYWKYRSIKIAVIFHVLWDLMATYLATRQN